MVMTFISCGSSEVIFSKKVSKACGLEFWQSRKVSFFSCFLGKKMKEALLWFPLFF